MVTHVRTTIRYDGPALAGHDMDVQDLAPALLALADIIQIANRKFNGENADIRVLVNADVEQRCFQIDLSLVQTLLEVARGFLAEDGVKTALAIAKDIGIIGGAAGGVLSLFKLIKFITEKRPKDGTRFEVKTESGITTLVNGNGNSVNVQQDVYLLASDPLVLEKMRKVLAPLQKPGYETLSFVEGDRVIDTVTREDARRFSEVPTTILDPSHEDVSTITGHIRIKSPQYEGKAKWSVLWGGRTIEVAMPLDFVTAFQGNKVDVPPNTILTVEMEQKIALDDDGKAIGSPSFVVLSVRDITLPPKATEQLDWALRHGPF